MSKFTMMPIRPSIELSNFSKLRTSRIFRNFKDFFEDHPLKPGELFFETGLRPTSGYLKFWTIYFQNYSVSFSQNKKFYYKVNLDTSVSLNP